MCCLKAVLCQPNLYWVYVVVVGEALKAPDPNKSADDGDGRPLKYRYCEKATKFEKNPTKFFSDFGLFCKRQNSSVKFGNFHGNFVLLT